MGLSGSRRRPRRMSDSEEDQDSSTPHRYNLRSGGSRRRTSGAGDDEDEADLSSIVAYLIRSGQIRFISQDHGDSDSEDASDNEFVAPSRPPEQDLNPDVNNLKKSDVYAAIMRSSGRWSDKRWLSVLKPSLPGILTKRELGLGGLHQFSHGDQCLINTKFLPNRMERLCSYHHKAFCGSYSADGNVFLSACQDQYLRVYDTSNDKFELIKAIRARDVGWSILDTAFSPDGRYAAYSSWSDCIHLCNIYGDHDIHESLPVNDDGHSFCIFSLDFSNDNKEIMGGANDGNIYVYDREANKRILKIDAHDDDVNSVRFADISSQILYSGGDDGLIKVWDRRTLSEDSPVPVGIMAGHSDGTTFIDSKGDARFFISNSKDQTLKLWDVRKFSDQAAVTETKKVVASQRWDYRWQQVPRRMSRKKELKGDTSVMTYRGHCILHTLIRCRFSPGPNTGQRYIITGCATGSIIVYDLLTGQVARRLEGHNSCVRDVAWHPYKNSVISTSWDGTLGHWYYYDYDAHDMESRDEVHESCEERGQVFRNRRPLVKPTKEVAFPGLFD